MVATTSSEFRPRLRRQTSIIVADPEDALGDEQQHARERRVRHMGEQAAAERRQRQREAGATSAPSCETPPVSATIAVRGGLALTGKAPRKPASRLAAPTPTKSRPTSGPAAGSETKLRVVAAVCTMTTSATMMASGAICGRSASATCGQPSRGVVASIVPSVATPRPSSPKTTTTSGGEREPDQRAGKARAQALARKHQRQHEQAEAERRQAGLAERAGERDDLGDERAAGRRDADAAPAPG